MIRRPGVAITVAILATVYGAPAAVADDTGRPNRRVMLKAHWYLLKVPNQPGFPNEDSCPTFV